MSNHSNMGCTCTTTGTAGKWRYKWRRGSRAGTCGGTRSTIHGGSRVALLLIKFKNTHLSTHTHFCDSYISTLHSFFISQISLPSIRQLLTQMVYTENLHFNQWKSFPVTGKRSTESGSNCYHQCYESRILHLHPPHHRSNKTYLYFLSNILSCHNYSPNLWSVFCSFYRQMPGFNISI